MILLSITCFRQAVYENLLFLLKKLSVLAIFYEFLIINQNYKTDGIITGGILKNTVILIVGKAIQVYKK